MLSSPTLTLTLSDSGGLSLITESGLRHDLPANAKPSKNEQLLLQLLYAKKFDLDKRFGTPSDPTDHIIWHLRHSHSDRCPFCAAQSSDNARAVRSAYRAVSDGTVKVRRLPATSRALRPRQTPHQTPVTSIPLVNNPADIGL